MTGHLAIVEQLIAAGANLDFPISISGKTISPFLMACHRKRFDVAEVLLTAGCRLDPSAEIHGRSLLKFLKSMQPRLAQLVNTACNHQQ